MCGYPVVFYFGIIAISHGINNRCFCIGIFIYPLLTHNFPRILTDQSVSPIYTLMEDKRRKLLETAIHLFGTNGFWNSSTAQIAKEAGVATGTLFNYFASKDILISEVLVTLKSELMQSMQSGLNSRASVKDQLLSIWNQAAIWAIENSDRFILMEQLSSSAQITQEAQETMEQEYAFIIRLFKQGKEEGVIADIDEEFLLLMILQLGKATLQAVVSGQLSGTEQKLKIEQGFEIYWKGIST